MRRVESVENLGPMTGCLIHRVTKYRGRRLQCCRDGYSLGLLLSDLGYMAKKLIIIEMIGIE